MLINSLLFSAGIPGVPGWGQHRREGMEIQPGSLGSSRPWGNLAPLRTCSCVGEAARVFPVICCLWETFCTAAGEEAIPAPARALMRARTSPGLCHCAGMGLVGASSPLRAEAALELTRAFVLSPAATNRR